MLPKRYSLSVACIFKAYIYIYMFMLAVANYGPLVKTCDLKNIKILTTKMNKK